MIGYFGKVPSHGDFVSRGLPPDLVAAWDTWLQACMLESQRQLGDRWLPLYLNSPVWRFAISPGVLGKDGLGGVMMPSVDRVGRYFPLMIAATGSPPLLDWYEKQGAWYEEAEEVARASLDQVFLLAHFNALTIPVAPRVKHTSAQEGSRWWTTTLSNNEGLISEHQGMPQSDAFTSMLIVAQD